MSERTLADARVFGAVWQINHHHVVVGEDASLICVRIDVAGVGVGHKHLPGLHMGAVATEDADMALAKVHGFCFGLLKDAHPPLLQSSAKPAQQLAWAKASSKAIDDASRIDVFGRAAPCLQLPSRKQLEEGPPLLSDQWHQRTKVALLHEIVRALQALQIGFRHGRRHRPVPHRGSYVVGVVQISQPLASFHGAAQKGSHPRLRPGSCGCATCPSFLLLCVELLQHDIDGFGPASQELPSIQGRRRFPAEGALFDDDHIDAAPGRGIRGAEPRQAAAHNKELAA